MNKLLQDISAKGGLWEWLKLKYKNSALAKFISRITNWLKNFSIKKIATSIVNFVKRMLNKVLVPLSKFGFNWPRILGGGRWEPFKGIAFDVAEEPEVEVDSELTEPLDEIQNS